MRICLRLCHFKTRKYGTSFGDVMCVCVCTCNKAILQFLIFTSDEKEEEEQEIASQEVE